MYPVSFVIFWGEFLNFVVLKTEHPQNQLQYDQKLYVWRHVRHFTPCCSLPGRD